MFPNFIKNTGSFLTGRSPTNAAPLTSEGSPINATGNSSPSASAGGNDSKKKAMGSVNDFMTKSGQFFTSIQGTLDKQIGQIVEAVHTVTNPESAELSVIPSVQMSEFDPYLALVKEHWTEYKGIVSSLSVVPTLPSVDEDTAKSPVGAFREIPQVFFHTDFKESGFVQHQIFTQPLRVSAQNQGKINNQLSVYLRSIDSHLVKHLSNVDGLLRSLMTIATIQTDVAAAHDRVVAIRLNLAKVSNGEVNTGLKLHALARRKARLYVLLSLLVEVEKVSQANASVDVFVKQGDFATATELIQATQSILSMHLAGLKMTERIATVVDEHGRSIDGELEAEFVESVCEFIFSKSLTIATLESMRQRNLLVPCLQLQLKETATRRLRKEMTIAGVEVNFESLIYFLNKVTNFLDLVWSNDSSSTIEKLTCLRLFEAITSTGLSRISQIILKEYAVERTIKDLFPLVKLCRNFLTRIESIYWNFFSLKKLDEHLSFAYSIVGSGSQNGFSPDVYSAIASVGRVCLTQFRKEAPNELLDEKWDKSFPPTDNVLKLIARFEQPDDSPSSAKSVCVNGIFFLLVPGCMDVLNKIDEFCEFGMLAPGLVVETLVAISEYIRHTNTQIKNLVLDGKMCVTTKKPVNATNLALASQTIGILAQISMLVGKLFAQEYNLDVEGLLLLDPRKSPTGGYSPPPVENARPAVQDLVHQVVLELNEHRMEIFFKLSDILIGRFEFHLGKWIVPAPGPSPTEGIEKDFSQMYKVLVKSLQSDNLKRVFARAFNECAHRFRERLGEQCHNIRPELLTLYKQLVESISTLKSSINAMIEDMLDTFEAKYPLLNDPSAIQLRQLLVE